MGVGLQYLGCHCCLRCTRLLPLGPPPLCSPPLHRPVTPQPSRPLTLLFFLLNAPAHGKRPSSPSDTEPGVLRDNIRFLKLERHCNTDNCTTPIEAETSMPKVETVAPSSPKLTFWRSLARLATPSPQPPISSRCSPRLSAILPVRATSRMPNFTITPCSAAVCARHTLSAHVPPRSTSKAFSIRSIAHSALC